MSIKLKKLFLLVFLSNIFYIKSFAQSAQDSINQQDWIIRQQQNILEDKKRNLEFDVIKKEHELNIKDEKEANKTQPMVNGKMSKCIEIKEVRFLDSKALSSFRQRKIVKPFIGKCLEAETLASIIKLPKCWLHHDSSKSAKTKFTKRNF